MSLFLLFFLAYLCLKHHALISIHDITHVSFKGPVYVKKSRLYTEGLQYTILSRSIRITMADQSSMKCVIVG